MLKLYNTLSRIQETFQPIEAQKVRLYTCGPTVYDFAHIGNLRTYIFEDLLRRVLEFNGFAVTHAMNITDVGHLTSDADEGEDKMDKGAKRENKHPLDIAKFYTEQFIADCKALNILPPTEGYTPATTTIPEQIEIIKILEEKGFIYKDEFAIYFDTSKLTDYGKLAGQKLEDKKTGAREEVVIDIHKRNPQDFVLWFFLAGRYEDHILQWDSPWGKGFPGWHIECSAISRKLLGQPFDIHTGGVDHIGTHHSNEIAQSEAAFNVPLAHYWLHGEHMIVAANRMGKSEGNAFTLNALAEKGYRPLDFRYFCLQANWRTQLNFTWESLDAAHTALSRLYSVILNEMKNLDPSSITTFSPQDDDKKYLQRFLEAINDDLNIPKALALTWELIADKELPGKEKIALLRKFDSVFGLGLTNPPEEKVVHIPDEVQKLITERDEARKQKNFAKSDDLRSQIEAAGFEVLDTPDGTKIK